MKFHWFAEGGVGLLFDLAKDPLEQHNLAGNPEYADVRAKLERELTTHLTRH